MARQTTLSPWRAPGCETPLLCWRDEQLVALATALEAAVSEWRADWAVPGGTRIACAAAESAAAGGGRWRSLASGDAVAGWLHVPDAAPSGLAAALFPSATPGPLAQQVVADCEQDALGCVLASLQLAGREDDLDGPELAECVPWSGVVEVSFPPPLGWRLLLRSDVMQSWCHAHGVPTVPPAGSGLHPPLASAAEALAARPLKLEVLLQGCEIELGSLQRLGPGDVVCLQHAIDAPAAVTDAAGVALFTGYLGRRGGSKAVELADRAPATARTEPRQEALQ